MVNTNSVLSSILFSQTIDWNIKQFFSSTSINSSFELKRIGKAITRRKDQMVVEDDKRYKRITIKTNCGGVFVRDEVLGKDIKTKKQYYVKAGQLAVSKIDARNGAFGIVPPEADGAIITGNFWVYDVNPEIANIDYLILLLSSNVFVQAWQDCSNGSGNRLYLQEEKFLNYKIPMPEADVQKDLIRKYNTQLAEAKKDQDSIDNLQYQIEQYILKKLGISFKRSSFNGLIGTTYYKNLTRWDPTYLSNKIIINSNEKMIDMAAVIAHFMVDTSGKRLRINTKEDPDKKFAYIGMEHVEKNTGKVMATVYTAIAAFENMVRQFVVKILMENKGENWWTECVSDKIRKSADSRKAEEDKIKWHTHRGTSMINYVDFADLANIMGQNYDLFEVHIVSLEWAKQIFTTLEKSRNVIMHSGELGERDIERIGINIRDWISQVGA